MISAKVLASPPAVVTVPPANTTVVVPAKIVLEIAPVSDDTVIVSAYVAGPKGDPGTGTTGSSESLSAIASTPLSGQRIVTAQADGTLVYHDPTQLAFASLPAFITLGAVVGQIAPIDLVVNTGKTLIQNRLYGITGPPVALSSMGVGTDSTAAAVAQTQLNPSVSGSVYLQAFDATPTISGQTVTYTTTFGTGVANFSICEVGTFNGTTNGTSIMYNRIVVSSTGIGKSSSFALALTLTSLQN